MNPKELLKHPSVGREFNRIRSLGGTVEISEEDQTIILSPGIMPLEILTTFLGRLRKLDDGEILNIKIKEEDH